MWYLFEQWSDMEGKLIVRQKKKSALGIDAYKGLGVSLLGLGGAAHTPLNSLDFKL